MKRELEQKEKVTKQLKSDVNDKTDNNQSMMDSVETRVKQKADALFGMHKQLREKDTMIEQLEQLLRSKEQKAQELRLANEQGRRTEDGV